VSVKSILPHASPQVKNGDKLGLKHIIELNAKKPVDRQQEIVFSGDRLSCEGEEYVIEGDGELRLICYSKSLNQR